MENHGNFLGKNLKRLPPGLRFHPTDEEILFEYLRCKVFDLSLPASVIPQIGFLNFDPWELPGNAEERRYFFSKKESKSKKQKKSQRMTTRYGYWKSSGSTKQISAPSTINCMGMFTQGLKKSFVFYEGIAPNGRRTPWRMHEYSLDFNDEIQVQDWVICNVYQKKRNEDMLDSSTLLHEEQCSDNIICSSPTSSAYNAGPSTYYCSSPTSSSNSIYKASHYETNNYGEGNSYYSP